MFLRMISAFKPRKPAWAALFLIVFASTAYADQAIHITDATGSKVEFARPPERIISLQPSLAETVCALGACSKLVGVDRYTVWPPELDKLPRVGGGLEPPVAAISALKPDVVLVSSYSRVVPALRAAGLKVVVLHSKSHAQIRTMLHTIGSILGQPPAAADQVWQRIEGEIAQSSQSVPATLRGQRLFMAVASCGPYAASAGSFLGEIAHKMALRNVVNKSQGEFPRLSADFVMAEKPDYLLLSAANAKALQADPRWSSLPAVQAGKVCVYSEAQIDVFSHHGPRMGQSAQLIAQCLQGKIPSVSPQLAAQIQAHVQAQDTVPNAVPNAAPSPATAQ